MRRWQARAWIAAVILSLAVVWGYAVVRHAFDDDEFQHTHVAWLLHHGQRPYADFFEHHLVLYHRLMAPLFHLGEGPGQLLLFRGVSLAAAAATLVLLYQAGRLLGASPPAAAAGIWLLGLTPMFLLKMSEARPEALAMLAFAAALRLMLGGRRGAWGMGHGDESRSAVPQGDGAAFRQGHRWLRRLEDCPWRFLAIGILAALMTLFSQKYAVVAGGLLVANFALHGWRPSLALAAAAAVAAVLYVAWMLGLGVGREAFAAVVLLNLRWRYAFSPASYAAELYLTAGGLVATGLLGLLRSLTLPPRRRSAWALAVLFAASLALILLVPVPYRQSFLPLLAMLSLGAMGFCAALFRLAARHHRAWIGPAAAVMLGGASLAALPRQLAEDNRADLRRMAAIADLAPAGPVFDGRGLMVCRPHLGHHACMHHEILLMIDLEAYADEVVAALKAQALPPVIHDYRVAQMPEAIRRFIAENYLPSDIPDVLVAGLRRDRLMPGRTVSLAIPVAGRWRASWRGQAGLALNGTPLENGASIDLDPGEHRLVAQGLAWDFRLVRDYR
jgi:MFS family permease